MRKLFALLAVALSAAIFTSVSVAAQTATVRLNAAATHQQITGFGGFVCSPQFGYNHMSTTEIKRVWGPTSTVGCNIMRLYIPIGKGAWGQSLQTAKTAKQMGLIVFASPWGQPAEWKTNGTSNAKNSDGTTGKLKRENWPDYAQYLEDYVQYLRQNGVELDAISIQNEPDWAAEYAGCLWSASEIAEFVKLYGQGISCKVMAPESIGCSDGYVNALNKSDVLPGFDIYGGHQYGGIQSAYKNLAAKGKEIWMTEYLINWNEGSSSSRNFDYAKDIFNFFRAINTCMLGDFNAWIHYAAKRYYAMLGDGQCGTSNGTVTKRGYVMAHFARFVTGMTRIDATFVNSSLEGSAYLSQTGDTAVVVIANEGSEEVGLTVDLPFYTLQGELYATTRTKSLGVTAIDLEAETCRPVCSIPAQSVCTLRFLRSRDRQPSNMTATTTRYDRIDDMSATNTSFGTNYKLSGTTRKFDHSTPLISSRTNTDYGYVQLNDRYSRLVMEVKRVTSTLNYTSAKTTLTYVNAQGNVSTHDYGELDLNRRENFALVLDLSPQTLTDGCQGLISLTNNNWSSTLTITFGDVYLSSNYAATLAGDYVADDSNVLDYTADPACTSIDLTQVTSLPSSLPWLSGTNRIVFASEDCPLTDANVVIGSTCHELSLTETGGDFHPARSFTAENAQITLKVNALRFIMLPFHAVIPDGARAYTVGDDLSLTQMRSIPANTPVLIEGAGDLTFTGSSDVSYAVSPLDAVLRGTYATITLYPGDYVLDCRDGKWGLVRLTAATLLPPFGVYANPRSQADFITLDLSQTGIRIANNHDPITNNQYYDLQGRRVDSSLKRGIYINNGQKIIIR